MPNVLNEFEGDGVTRTFNFSMTGGYLSRDYVFFYTRPNEDLLAYTPYDDDDVTWISDYTVRTAAPIPVGTTFVILRSTTLEPLVDFQNTSRITEKNLDTATWQSIHIAAETSDVVSRIREVATDAKLESAEALLSAQTAASDAQTASNAAVAAVQSAVAAQASALQAGVDAGAAALSAQAATDAATAAEDTANAAALQAATAIATANSAVSTANTAVSTANTANATAGTAVATATSASTTAGSAAADASAAVAAATTAVNTANTAVGAANTAVSVANEAKSLVDVAVAGGVVSFNGRTGDVTSQSGDYTKAQVGLGAVDNTSDADKPLSTAAVAALGAKADKSYVDTELSSNASADRSRANHTGYQPISTVTNLQTALDSKVDKVSGKQLSTEDYTSAEKSKLASVAAGATANSSDSSLRNRDTHTGTQAIGTIVGLQAALDSKVSAVAGKQLSTEDYTSAEKSKLSGIAAGATANSTDASLRERSTHTGTQAIGTITGVLGAVSSGAVVERGSNANGTYIRFMGGLQICHNRYFVTSVPKQSNTTITCTASASFVGVPAISVALAHNANTNVRLRPYNSTSGGVSVIVYNDDATLGIINAYVDVTFVGAWQ